KEAGNARVSDSEVLVSLGVGGRALGRVVGSLCVCGHNLVAAGLRSPLSPPGSFSMGRKLRGTGCVSRTSGIAGSVSGDGPGASAPGGSGADSAVAVGMTNGGAARAPAASVG